MGQMIGTETEKSASEIVKPCLEIGVLSLTAKKGRLLLAWNIPFSLLEQAVGVIAEVCSE